MQATVPLVLEMVAAVPLLLLLTVRSWPDAPLRLRAVVMEVVVDAGNTRVRAVVPVTVRVPTVSAVVAVTVSLPVDVFESVTVP